MSELRAGPQTLPVGAASARLTVAGLFIHPVKACGRVAVDKIALDTLGAIDDRRWMLIDSRGHFVSQRTHKALALVHTRLHDGYIDLSTANRRLLLPREWQAGRLADAKVWNDTVRSPVHEDGSRWFSTLLGEPIQLVHFPRDSARQVDLSYGQPGDRVGFADAYPLLVTSNASLDALNTKLHAAGHSGVTMDRFRPNVVLSGGSPFVEDALKQFSIGGLRFRGVKKCARCNVVQIDPETGESEIEPLRTLATFRLIDGQVMFGMNVIHNASGTIRVGDSVEVSE